MRKFSFIFERIFAFSIYYYKMSYIQDLVKKQLQYWFPSQEIIENYRPEWLIGLEIDLYLPELNLAIEVNGLQHYIKIDKFFKCNADFEKQVVRDFAKERMIKNELINFVKIRQGSNLLTGLQKQMNAILKMDLKINHNIEIDYNNHWLANKHKFLEGNINPSFVKITFLSEEKRRYKELFKNKQYKEAFDYIMAKAYFK